MIDKSGNISFKTVRTKVTCEPDPLAGSNQAPVVIAKSLTELHIISEQCIHIEDNGSYDPDGEIVSYSWRDMNGILLSDTKVLDRKLYYCPQYDLNGDGTIKYINTLTVTDNEGKSSSQSFEIIVHKLPNKAPIANSQDITVLENSSNNAIRLTGCDLDGDNLTYTVITQPLHGTYTDGIYTPNANYNGSDSFSFTANDGLLTSCPATVSITVTDVVEPDTTAPIITLRGDSVVTLSVGDTYTELGATANDDRDGELTVVISGNVDTSIPGTYTLSYTCRDLSNNSAGVTRTVIVNEATDITPDSFDISSLTELLGDNIALFHHDDYKKLELPVLARNSLEDGVSENLWYEEVVPKSSKFFFAMAKPTNHDEADKPKLERFEKSFENGSRRVQIGANKSIGYGFSNVQKVSK